MINTNAIENPDLITTSAKKYGTQCVVVSIDVRKINSSEYRVFSRFGSHSTGLDPVIWAKQVEEYGAGEIMLLL